jgi:hypothetical protein
MSTIDTININPDRVTVESVEAIRAALHVAFLDSCNILAQVHNSLITPEQASCKLAVILAPLQVEPCEDEEDEDTEDPCEPHERWTEKQMLEADYRMDELKDREVAP